MSQVTESLARRGESLVIDYLAKQGFSIIERNFRVRGGEIDIIARKGDLICFVEVKTRQSLRRGRGIMAVTKAKMNKMLLVAKMFLARHRRPGCKYRFDAAEVIWKKQEQPRINYFKNIFQEE